MGAAAAKMAGRPSEYYESNFISRRWRANLVKMVGRLMRQNWKSLRHLDVGVGDGYTVRLLKPEGEVVGIDPDPNMQPLAASRGIDFRVGSAYQLPFPDASFDLITCIEVVEHLEKPYEGLVELRRVLAPGGFMIITTPIPKTSWRLLWWGWTRFGPGKKWKHTPHVADVDLRGGHSTTDGLESMLRKIGLRIQESDRCNLGFIAGVRVSEIQ